MHNACAKRLRLLRHRLTDRPSHTAPTQPSSEEKSLRLVARGRARSPDPWARTARSRHGDATRRACDNRVGPESVSSLLSGGGFDEAVGERAVVIDPPIAQEGPILSRLVNLIQVAIDDQYFFFIAGSFRDDPAERIGHERLTPEVQLSFVTDSVADRDINAVSNRMRALNRLPRGMLRTAHLWLFIRQPADGGGIEKKLRSRQSSQARGFGKPLIPTNQRANLPILRFVRAKAEIAGGEIEFLVVERIVRYVHLAVLAGNLSIRVDYHRGVVIDAGSSFLEDRSDNDDLLLACDFAQRFR